VQSGAVGGVVVNDDRPTARQVALGHDVLARGRVRGAIIGLPAALLPVLVAGRGGPVASKGYTHLLPFFGPSTMRLASHSTALFSAIARRVKRCMGVVGSL
jgi:hypothetical protein